MARREEINLIASSDPTSGASQISSDGSQFSIQLDEAIQVPREARNITVSMENSTIWNTVPNIITGTNDLFKLVDDGTDSGVANTYNLVIDQGLYSLAGLNTAILRELQNAGAPTSPSALISLSGDSATQKSALTVNYTGISIDFTIAQSFRDILGFNSQVLGPTVSKPLTFLSDNTAAFNQVNFFLVHSDIVTRGVRFNNQFSQVLDQVLIDKAPGSQIVSTPFRPPVIPEPSLAGAIRNTLRFWLTDDQNAPVNTAGEIFSARIVIRYELL